MEKCSSEFYEHISMRRTVREYSTEPVPIEIIENCIRAAGSAPSGANLQPWHFAIIQDNEVKTTVRKEAEKEEFTFYHHKAPAEWLKALEPLGTNDVKPFLTTAPYLIAVFSKSYDVGEDGTKVKNYYVKESVGIATGILLSALHFAGLATLTHTPSPMDFLNKICNRPKNEKPYMIVVTGYPAEDATVPVYGKQKKSLIEISSVI